MKTFKMKVPWLQPKFTVASTYVHSPNIMDLQAEGEVIKRDQVEPLVLLAPPPPPLGLAWIHQPPCD